MPKIKIKDFKGIYTNADENDLRLESFTESVNFIHRGRYAEYESRRLAEFTLPDIETFLGGDAGQGWTWEKGIYTILTNDPFNIQPTYATYEVLVLIAKKVVGSTTHRLIWMKDIGNSGDWYEMTKYGNYSSPTTPIYLLNYDQNSLFDDSLISTDKEGEVFFREDRGILKIYLPHDCFWLGRLERTYTQAYREVNTFNQFYFDRLVEPVDLTDLGISYNTFTGPWDIEFPNFAEPICKDNRRLGLSATVSIAEDQTLATTEADISFTYVDEDPDIWSGYPPHDPNVPAYVYLITNTETGEPVVSPVPDYEFTNMGGETSSAYFFAIGGANTVMAIPAYYYGGGNSKTEFMRFRDDTTLVDNYGAIVGNIILHTGAELSGGYYLVNKADFDADVLSPGFKYTGGDSIGNTGFSTAAIKRIDLIATAVLDEKEEIIIWKYGQDVNATGAKYAIHIQQSYIARDCNARMTRLRYYLKVTGDTDFSLVKDINFLDTEQKDHRDFYITSVGKTSQQGTTLSQNIGFLLDVDKLYQYDIITGFKSVAVENGIGIGVSNDDAVNVYYSVVGGGVLQSNLMYTGNILPFPNISYVNALVGANGNIAAITDKYTYIIKPSEQAGVLAFDIIQTLEMGVKNDNDVASTGGNFIISTRDGIFLTNGYTAESLSKPIDNVVRTNYTTSTIKYNPILHELYYRPTVSEDIYRYRFVDQVWEVVNATIEIADVEDGDEIPEV